MAKDDMLSGLSTKSPSASDASTRPPTTATVKQDATRSSTTPNQGTLGPRTA